MKVTRRDPGFVKIRRGLLAHLPEMSSNAVKLYVWLHLKAHWQPGPKRGWVEASYEDIIGSLAWTKSMVRRTVEELTKRGYIEVIPAANQHQVTRIKILKYDLGECDSATFTGEHTKPAENPAVLSGVLSAVSVSEKSSEHSNPAISQNQRDLQAPKNAVEIKNGIILDAVRRPVDAERRSISNPVLEGGGPPLPRPTPLLAKSFSPLKKRKKLSTRLAKQIHENGNDYINELDSEERAAFSATGYEPEEVSALAGGFVFAVCEVYEKHKNDGTSPGNLCSKIIDHCMSQQEGCKTLGSDPSEYFWPPDFQDHRHRLREEERQSDARAKAERSRA